MVAELRDGLVRTRTVAALNKGLTGIFVPVVLGLNGGSVVRVGVSEREVVRTPFDEQERKKRHRENAARASFPTDLSICLLH